MNTDRGKRRFDNKGLVVFNLVGLTSLAFYGIINGASLFFGCINVNIAISK